MPLGEGAPLRILSGQPNLDSLDEEAPEGQGLEVDKMNRAAAQAHFVSVGGLLFQRLGVVEIDLAGRRHAAT